MKKSQPRANTLKSTRTKNNKLPQPEWPQTPFYGILRHLCDEHEREVTALQRKVEDLDIQLQNVSGDESSCDAEPSAPPPPSRHPPPAPPPDDAIRVAEAEAVPADAVTKAATLGRAEQASSTLNANASSTPQVKDSPSGKLTRPAAGTWRTGEMSVPGFVEEFHGVSPSDSSSCSPQKALVRPKSPNGRPFQGDDSKTDGDDSKTCRLAPPASASAVGTAMSAKANGCESTGGELGALSDPCRSSQNSAVSFVTSDPGDCVSSTSRVNSKVSGTSDGDGKSVNSLTSNDLRERDAADSEKIRNSHEVQGGDRDGSKTLPQSRTLDLDERKLRRVKSGGGILRQNSQFDEIDKPLVANDRRISWAQGHEPTEEEEDAKKIDRANYKVMDVWQTTEDEYQNLQRLSSQRKTHGVTRLSGAIMAIQKTFQTMAQAMEKTPTWESTGSTEPNLVQEELIKYHKQIHKRGLEMFVSDPNSGWHFLWDLFSMVVIAYDFLIVPLAFFSLDDNAVTLGMSMLTATFWSCSIVRSFFTGYLHEGDIVMTFSLISRHYMHTWLFPDLLINLIEWCHVVRHFASGGSYEREFSSFVEQLKTLRLFRVLQLLRAFKAFRIMKSVEERITRERYSVAFKLVKYFAGILIVNHLIACIWYGIGDSHKGSGPNWLDAYLDADSNSFTYRYATSFHWALTQFTPASIEVQPRNALERLFAIVVLLFALVTVSSFISGITGAVMELRNLAATKSKQFWVLRRYLHESSVPTELALRVQHYLDFAWRLREQRLLEENVEVLGLLSGTLRVQLNTAIFEPRISVHPLFVLISKMASFIMQTLCNTAVARVMLIQGDTLFSISHKMTKMFVICTGELEYQHLDESSKSDKSGHVRSGVWVCEPALWTEWSTYGTLTAKTDCEIVSVDAGAFGDAAKMADEIWCEAVHYARGFVQGLNRIDKSRLTDLFYSNLIEGLWFRLLNDWNVRQRPTVTNALERVDRASITSTMGGAIRVPGAPLANVAE